MAAMNPVEAPKRSKRDRLRAKAGEIFHMKNGKDDDSTPTPAEAFSATDKEDLVKKAQDLLNKKKDENGSEGMKKETVGLVALGALGVLGPVAYEMWKRRKEKKKQQQRRGISGENNGEEACEEEVEEEVEEAEAEGEEENDQGEEEEGEGSSEYQEFLTWIPLAFHAQNAYTMANDGYRLAGLA